MLYLEREHLKLLAHYDFQNKAGSLKKHIDTEDPCWCRASPLHPLSLGENTVSFGTMVPHH